ncbi:MAG: ATP-binding cassette domain-containing protein [Bacteroidales bacterium]|nr:ATP-binding cassette domain-containing protein [Bacteroidales bacterium]
MNTLLRAENIQKEYSGHKALSDISLEVPSQSIYGLLGPNGAGKTTFIRIINQITAPDSGTVFLKGEKLNPKHISRIGYLPEERGLYRKMEVGEQALYLAQLKGLSRADAMEKLKKWFIRFDITPWWRKKVEELSKGMQQKVQFIITVIHEPELLIFDEPFSGFDPINVNLLKDEILQLKKNGATIIFSTHNMASVEELCDHIALINKAEKILEGSMREIKANYKTNTFEISLRDIKSNVKGMLPDDFLLINESVSHGITTMNIRIPGNTKPNELLGAILPYADLVSFREVFPSMNDIFINMVQEYTG